MHGDVQAGNVLLLPGGGAKLLDAEIAHVGDPAFDVGLLLAHVLLAALARGTLDAAAAAVRAHLVRLRARARRRARRRSPTSHATPASRCMRRTIGAARVAAVQDTTTALAAVDLACTLIRTPPGSPDALRAAVRAFAR